MAFVFEEERKFDFNNGIEKNELGPGQYLPQTKLLQIKKGLSSFESTSSKFPKSETITPGPGAYYHDDTKDVNNKNKDNEKLLNVSKLNSIENHKQIISQDDPETKNYVKAMHKLKTNYEKLGFSIKEKRFQEKRGVLVPGPGYYLNDKSKEQCRITSAKCLEVKGKICKLKSGQLRDKFGHISSIPQKETYGYEIDKDNNLVKKTNPESYKTFSGINGDTVGPGTYDVTYPEQWNKTGTNWAKSQVFRGDNIEKEKKKKKGKNDMSNNDVFIPNEPTNEWKSGCNNLNVDMFKHYSVKQLKRKKGTINSDIVKIIERKDIPGPGYYYDVNLHSGFYNAAKVPRKNNSSKSTYFGSTNERFNGNDFTSSINNTNLGPGQYFADDHSQAFHRKHSVNKHRNSSKIPFSSGCERFGAKSYSSNNDRIFSSKPHPTSSSTSLASTSASFYNKNNSSMNGTFYRKQKRFIEAEKEMERLREGPGPGSYINPFSNTGTSNTILFNGRFVDIRKGKDLLMVNTRPQTSKDDVIEKKRREFGPPVGRYNPDSIMTISYRNLKKLNYGNGEDVAFNSGKMQGRCASSLEKDPVGPGSYIKLNEREINENIVPFNSTTKRGLSTNEKPKNDFEKKKELIGPGRYDYNECFSWIKKSFNVKYI